MLKRLSDHGLIRPLARRIPATALATKGDSITFNTPTIEGTVMRRNKADSKGNHPWKTEVTEGTTGVNAAKIAAWYDSVYEPDYTTSGH